MLALTSIRTRRPNPLTHRIISIITALGASAFINVVQIAATPELHDLGGAAAVLSGFCSAFTSTAVGVARPWGMLVERLGCIFHC